MLNKKRAMKTFIKKHIVAAMSFLKIFNLLKRQQKKKIIILMYHRFSKNDEQFKIKQEIFENQIKFLKSNYNIISMSDLYENIIKNNIPDNSLLITIDDGYNDNYNVAYPILKKYSVPAIIFLSTDFIDKKSWLWSNKLEYILKQTQKENVSLNFGAGDIDFCLATPCDVHHAQLSIFNYCRTLRENVKNKYLDDLSDILDVRVPEEVTVDYAPLSWSQIREMSSHGIEFGCHSKTHPILARIDEKDLHDEIVQSKKVIEERIELPVQFFCYPNGQPEDVDSQLIDLVKKSGYCMAVSTVNGFDYYDNIENLFFLKRISTSTDNIPQLQRTLTRF